MQLEIKLYPHYRGTTVVVDGFIKQEDEGDGFYWMVAVEQDMVFRRYHVSQDNYRTPEQALAALRRTIDHDYRPSS